MFKLCYSNGLTVYEKWVKTVNGNDVHFQMMITISITILLYTISGGSILY